MSDPVDTLIARLLNLFGPPQCDDPEAYIDEVRDALNGYGADLLKIAGDRARDECKFFPRPAELRGFMQRELERRAVGKPRDAFEHLDMKPPPDPEAAARCRALVEKLKNHMLHGGPPVDAVNDFREPARLTERSRRMTGDTQ